MHSVSAKVVKGKVVTRAKLPEGAKLTVVVHDPASDVDLDESDVESIARADADLRAGKYVTVATARAFLRRR